MLEYYQKRLPEYEAIYAKPERQNDLKALVANLISDTKNLSVLEIACGSGWWTEKAAPFASSWVASDLDFQAIEIAKSKNMRPSPIPCQFKS